MERYSTETFNRECVEKRYNEYTSLDDSLCVLVTSMKSLISLSLLICDLVKHSCNKRYDYDIISYDNIMISSNNVLKFDKIVMFVNETYEDKQYIVCLGEILSILLHRVECIVKFNNRDANIEEMYRKIIDHCKNGEYDNTEEVIVGLLDILFSTRYSIISSIGAGGMGKVYLAKTNNLGTKWAIKMIKKDYEQNNGYIVEPYILKKMKHPNIPIIVDIEEDYFHMYIIEEYIDGVSLEEYQKKRGRISEKIVISWVKDILVALGHLHDHSIIHKDIKPSNIMISKQGVLKLIDFGISSRMDVQLRGIGTKGYSSPEQYERRKCDSRSDIYSLGITIYYLLTGKIPNRKNRFDKIIPISYYNRKVSKAMEYIVNRCIVEVPKKRYQTCKELSKELDRIRMINSHINKDQYQYLQGKIKVVVFIMIMISIIFCLCYGVWKSLEHDEVINDLSYSRYLIDNRRYSKAIESLNHMEDNNYGRYIKCIAYYNLGYYDKCIREINQVYKKETLINNRDINYILAKANYYKGNIKQASYYMRKSYKAYNSNIFAYYYPLP